MTEINTTTRFFFDSMESAANALITVLLHARITDSSYRITGRSAKQIFNSGLLLEGQISEISAKLEELPGIVRHDE